MRSIAFVALLVAGCTEPDALEQRAQPIVQGQATTEFPTTGVLLVGAPAGLQCSGTLIGCSRFLTAAHCVCDTVGAACQSGVPSQPMKVYLQHAGIFAVVRVHVHPSYSFPDDDVAILELARQVTGIVPTPLADQETALGAEAEIVGYGRSGGSSMDYGIKQVGPVVTAACPADAANPGHLCWDFEGTGSNTCNGDSGGPLFVDRGGATQVAGITSGGTRDDCLTGDHSYDNDVFTFRDFILAQAGPLETEACGDLPSLAEATIASRQGRLVAGGDAVLALEVPPGTAELRIAFNATDGGDVDLLVKRSGLPTLADRDCGAVGASSYGFCGLTSPAPGPWQARVVAGGAATYQLTATILGSAPTATDDAYDATAGQPLTVAADGVLGNDSASARGPLHAELVTGPTHGDLALAADGSFTYTAAADYAGVDAFVYHASDGTYAGTATVALTVAGGAGGEADAGTDPAGPGDAGGCGCHGGGASGGGGLALVACYLVGSLIRPRKKTSPLTRSRTK